MSRIHCDYCRDTGCPHCRASLRAPSIPAHGAALTTEDAEYLRALAGHIAATPRLGNSDDRPEGSGYIMISDTLAKRITERLREIASR